MVVKTKPKVKVKKVEFVSLEEKPVDDIAVDENNEVISQVILPEPVVSELQSRVELIFRLLPQESQKPSHLYNEGFNRCLELCKVAICAGLGLKT